MHAKSPSSFTVSLIIHAFVAAFIFFTTVYVAQQAKPPVIFELVAGPPTAPEQLVAPKLGNTTAPVKVTVPMPEPPQVQETAPVLETPKTVEPEVREVAPPTPPAPTKPAPTAKPKPDVSIAKEMKKASRMSYQQYLKSHPTPKPAPPSTNTKAGKVPRVDVTGIAKGVRDGSTTNTKGGGGGKALTREEHDALDTYYTFLKQELKAVHEPPPGVSDKLATRVTFDITASGTILNPRISKSSGNKEFDDSVLAAFRKVRSIGPTPNGKPDTLTLTFDMKDEG